MRPFKSALIAIPFFLLMACETVQPSYRYTLPAGQEGATCIAACAAARDICVRDVRETYDTCLEKRSYATQIYEDCLHIRRGIDPGNGRGGGTAGACAPPQRVCPPPDFLSCTREYNSCYTACGGQVTEEEGGA